MVQQTWNPLLHFIGAGDPLQAIKIAVTLTAGFTRRLRQHQSSNHEALRVLGIIDFGISGRNLRQAEEHERALHTRFTSHQRFQAWQVGYEWFNPHQEILDYIKANCRSCADLGLPDSVAKLIREPLSDSRLGL